MSDDSLDTPILLPVADRLERLLDLRIVRRAGCGVESVSVSDILKLKENRQKAVIMVIQYNHGDGVNKVIMATMAVFFTWLATS